MAYGYMGKLLFVDLSAGTLQEEPVTEELADQFMGGYGIGARVLYERMKPGVDPLGPDNILGFVTGPLTGTQTLGSGRYAVVGKSPLTGTWGDANSGGDFGPYLKFAGYDCVFFSGASSRPVYLFLDNGKAELRDASDIWGKDTQDTDDILRERHGARNTRVACIGPAGEKMSLVAAVVNDKGRAAGRSGLGAVMGSKKLKAVVATGAMKVPHADLAKSIALRREWLTKGNETAELFHDYGTPGITEESAMSGDSPVKNWSGAGPVDFPTAANINGDAVVAAQDRRYGCWRCTIACGGHMKQGPGRALVSHKPEYETLCMSGTNALNDDLESIIRFNDICNAYGMDTISVGAACTFAIECFENEIIDLESAGMQLRWGDGATIVHLARQIARREGIGEILADGVKRAAERLGQGAEEFAVHAAGQELPAHDPKFVPALAVTYRLDATPGRHTQGGAGWIMGDSFMEDSRKTKFDAEGFGELQNRATSMVHAINSAGICLFVYNSYAVQFIPDFLESVVGKTYTLDDLVEVGERIGTLRHLFNLREGHNPLNFSVHPRALGKPALDKGPLAGVTIDEEALTKDYLRAMDWDPVTAMPSAQKLEALGLAEQARAISA